MAWMRLKEYGKFYAWPKLSNLRWIVWKTEDILKRQPDFIHRWKKKVLIDPELFQAWILTEEAELVNRQWIDKKRQGKNNAIIKTKVDEM